MKNLMKYRRKVAFKVSAVLHCALAFPTLYFFHFTSVYLITLTIDAAFCLLLSVF